MQQCHFSRSRGPTSTRRGCGRVCAPLKPNPDGAGSRVRLLDQVFQTATLLEVRAHDRRGLVWTVCHAITSGGMSIRSAHMSTYGSEARDVFYVVDADGNALDDASGARLRDHVAAALD